MRLHAIHGSPCLIDLDWRLPTIFLKIRMPPSFRVCFALCHIVQAREEMEYAEESKETTYFDEEAAAAKEAVEGVSSVDRQQGRRPEHLTACD